MPIQRFLFSNLNIKGQHIHIENAWQAMLQDRHYPPSLTRLLGEVAQMTIMLANGLKHPGKITTQVQGQGPVNLLIVEADNHLNIRGIAKTNQEITTQNTLNELLGDGQILVTLENTITNKFFQSYVPRDGDTIAECFECYLSQSEQLPSKIWLSADEEAIGGVIIQKMPTTDEQDEDGWDRINMLTDTVKDSELLSLDTTTLMNHLFSEEDIQLFGEDDVNYDCPRDRKKVENMLLSLGQEEANKIIQEEGEIVVHNEICNFHERFSQADIDQLFKKH